jgi:Outer membrane protein beta-barrel domain
MSRPQFAAAIILVLLAAALMVPTSSAQGFGIKGGPMFTDFSSDVVDFSNRTGTELGIFYGLSRSGLLGFQGELNWLRKKTEGPTGEIRIDYVQLPTLLRLNAGSRKASGFALYGLIGPGWSIKVGDSTEGISVSDLWKGWDIGLIYGGGVEFQRLIVEGRYEQGLKQINNNIFGGTADVKSHSFSILFGFRIR